MDTEYLRHFEDKLEQELLRLCSSYKMLDGVMLETDDINEQWKVYAPEYIADAVNEVQNYPVVSVAWACYLGMAVACAWDADWERFSKAPYQAFYGERGFDDMDENIVKNLLALPLDGQQAKELGEMIHRLGEATVSYIRYEQIEPQSVMAFHIFARATKAMYRIGAAMELKRLGYKFEKVDLSSPQADA